MPGMINDEYLQNLAQERQKWEEGPLKKSLERFGVTESPNKFYTPLDVKDFDFLKNVGFPGQYPFTAGPYPCSVPGSGPTTGGGNIGVTGKGMVRAGRYSGYGTAEDTRDFYQKEIIRGRKVGPNVAFDLPTQIGLDADDPRARGEVGKVGVAFNTLADFEIMYEPFVGEADLDKIASNWTINAPAVVILAAYYALAEKRGIDPNKLKGTPQNDILKEYIARGTYIFPPQKSLRLTHDIFEFVSKSMKGMNTISIAGYHMREAGATREQAMGFHFANAIAYTEMGLKAGLDLDDLISHYTFNTLGGSLEMLKEVAIRRATRRMWAKIVRERFGGKNPKSWVYREAGGYVAGCWTTTRQRPLNNLTRTVIGGIAGALCGYVPTCEPPYDEPLGLGWSTEATQLSEDAARIIAYEAKLTEITDPLAGSYYIEALTDQQEAEGWRLIKKIDDMGGSVKAIENGFMPRAVAQSAYDYQRKLESGEELVVGVNAFTGENELEVMPQRLVPYPYDASKQAKAEGLQVIKLNKVRKERNNAKVKALLAQLKEAAQDEKVNVMPVVIACVKEYASIGEICGVFREVFGEYNVYGTF